MNKLKLNNVTLVAAGSTKITETLKAINICLDKADFYDVYFFSDQINPYVKPIKPMNSIKDYDKFILYELPKHIISQYCLTIHWDGFIVNHNAWDEDYYNYDYIGAPWPWMNYICGNGGFCMKSRKFLDTQKSVIPDELISKRPDDIVLCVDYRDQIEHRGCRYAPRHIAQKFSTEYGNYNNFQSFGFHDFHPNPQFRHLITS